MAQTPLNCAIIGAGIVGLGAGIALRNSGHKATIFEKSTFKNEIGAAITVAPNGNRILDHWGFDAKAAGETLKEQSRYVDPETLELQIQLDLGDVRERFGHNFNAFHRCDLHQGLRELAESRGVKIVLGKEVVGLDCEKGEIQFKDAELQTFDMIVVADGIKSTFVNQISGSDAPLIKIGRSVFRGLIPMDLFLNDPLVRPIFENQPSGFYAALSKTGTFIMTYPCRNDKILNVAIFHDTRANHQDDQGWNSPATLEEVLEVLDGLHPAWKAIVKHAGDGMKCFPIAQREALPRFNCGRAVVIGDAAHCMQPVHAQGGAMGLEDAASLEILFPPTFSPQKESIPQRLQLLNDFRLPRVNTTQLYSNSQMQRNAKNNKDPVITDHISAIRKFYKGPLMEMTAKPWGRRERQEFWYGYDVFVQARRAMEVRGREGGLMQEEVRHFF
ncbi:related to salicylate 1-monooxygenase [Ramularia collo-cygni]|uniref:Related to salicylate 1-monooxygenase n=1 Tax=Ramularia collo-cygni TaxID=112498 RepID=A0A2D3VLF8_9PEZI|nr:related to salicylate 1-monooxygenase [Ramularia collo-cygni]CZT25531.1 related to salicylate 1-monooxygenase [Ramularia collo-cygni]